VIDRNYLLYRQFVGICLDLQDFVVFGIDNHRWESESAESKDEKVAVLHAGGRHSRTQPSFGRSLIG
jgi:hypothetical protein